MKKILVTGGGGYVGTLLVNSLLNNGNHVTVVDTFWFGNFLSKNENLEVIKDDIRNLSIEKIRGHCAIVHLANIANDPSVAMDPELSWNVNVLGTHNLIDKASRAGIEHFIFGSSGSVYGIKEEPDVIEDMVLVPISTYNKTKMVSERVLLSYKDDMVVQILRPATVCGYSPRMRLDVSVNLLTMHALSKGKITVFGGAQIRPNIHIDDIADLYIHLINHPECNGIFNAGFENISILDIANLVTKHLPVEIEITESNDPRSYRVNSDRILATGFKPKKKVEDAIVEIIEKYNSRVLQDKEEFYNLKWMQSHQLSD